MAESVENLLTNAASYANALATIPMAGVGVYADGEPAFWLLSGFAIELSLKAAVLHATGDERLLRSIGHDLCRAGVEASNVGFKTSPEVCQLIEILGHGHKDCSYRYTREGQVVRTTLPHYVALVLPEHVKLVARFVSRKIR
jgi:hypothetical protein